MKSKEELLVTRVFDAPSELVWKAWTTPEILAEWFAPGVVVDVRELDVRPGGHFRFGDPNDKDSGEYTGTYSTVRPLQELSFKVIDFSQTSDPAGIVAGFKVEFESLGAQTKMTLTAVPPEDSYDKSTFDAWSACFDRLAKVIR
jgi:uncharacterized protein YndB with AHSA1/START domain